MEPGKTVMLLPSSNPSLHRGPHLPIMSAIVLFPPAHVSHDLSIDFGPQIVSERVLVGYVIIVQYAHLLQLGEPADDLLKRAIDNSPCRIHIRLGLMHFFQFIRFHPRYPIGNHVAQRIQAFFGNGKRGHLRSIRKEITTAAEKQGLEPIRLGRACRHWPATHLQSGNREERSRIADLGNSGQEFRYDYPATLEQNLNNIGPAAQCTAALPSGMAPFFKYIKSQNENDKQMFRDKKAAIQIGGPDKESNNPDL